MTGTPAQDGGDGADAVAAVVVTYRPTETALDVIRDAAAQCGSVLVVDNTPTDAAGLLARTPLPENVRCLPMGGNTGLAAALNSGCRQLPDEARAVLLLDQDSRLRPGTVRQLQRHLRDPGIGVVGPAPWDAQEQRYLDPRTGRRDRLSELGAVVTSGMLVRRELLVGPSPFREDFFVDCVDQDFCLQVRRRGLRVVQDRSVLLDHRLGETRWHRVLGLRVRATHHPDWRLYAGARNGMVLNREHVRSAPGWVLTNVLQMTYWALTVLLLEPPRAVRLRLLLLGALDGLRGRPPRYGPP